MKTIRFVIEYDLEEPHDWSVSGIADEPETAEMHPVPKELPTWLPHILATMLRDSVAPRGPTIHAVRKPKDPSERRVGPP